jgi:four helix bundle protein
MSNLQDSKVYQKAYAFSVCVVKGYKLLCSNHREYTLSKQLLRSGTSIAANIAEANGAISENDFSAKMSIAYKECVETKYWLDLLKDTDYLRSTDHENLYKQADEIAKMLYAILKTTRINKHC